MRHPPDPPPRIAAARAAALRLLLALIVPLAASAASASVQPPAGAQRLAQAGRLGADGSITAVKLPFEQAAAGSAAPQQVHLLVQADLGPAPSGQALYVPGLLAHARVALNGQPLEDDLAHAAEPLPRSVHRIRLLRLPDGLLRDGRNTLDIDLAGTPRVGLSPLQIGPVGVLEREHEARVLGVVIGPAVVAAIMVCLGLCVLTLWARQRRDPAHAYFGVAAVGWGLHTLWTVLPWSPLSGMHYAVVWTALYSAFVILLVVFSLRFSGWVRPRLERVLWGLMLAAVPLLYAAAALGRLEAATEAWRAGCIALVAVAVVLVMARALRRRDVGGLLMMAAGAVSLAFGARDWWVAHAGADNNPAYLTPYAGLLFVALVSWMLIDGYVRAARELERANATLEARVAAAGAALHAALADMRRAKEAAEAADRAKTQFFAAASHDLRQPLHALRLNLAALPRAGLPLPVRAGLQRMRASLAVLGSMFEALLDLSRIETGSVVPEPVPFDLGALLHRLGDEIAPLAERRGLRLVLREGPAPRTRHALADPLLLERVLRNLLTNALQNTERGGLLLRWRLDAAGRRWQIGVWDTGHGIPQHEQARVFDEFYQADLQAGRRRDGLGLGLAIVRRLSELMDLRVALASRPGRGTRVTLSVPAAAPPQPHAAAPAAPAPLPDGACIAVLEDDDAVRDAMLSLLHSWQCRAVAAADTPALLAAWRSSGMPPVDALVADYHLRGGDDGLRAIDALRTAWADAALPALIVTGETAPQRLAPLAASGAAWLAKPLDPDRLKVWLAQALQARPVPPPAAGGQQEST